MARISINIVSGTLAQEENVVHTDDVTQEALKEQAVNAAIKTAEETLKETATLLENKGQSISETEQQTISTQVRYVRNSMLQRHTENITREAGILADLNKAIIENV